MSGCWLWTGTHTKTNYGTFMAYGKKIVYAHRFSYETYKKKNPGILQVCHHCDNPICVNPDHLFLGTQQDNNADRDRKKRFKVPPPKYGIMNFNNKLSIQNVIDIRDMAKNGTTQRKLAALFNISQPTVFNIVHKKIWCHI